MIHWIIFNLAVLIVSLSVVFNIRNELTTIVATALFFVAVILIIKDFVMMRG